MQFLDMGTREYLDMPDENVVKVEVHTPKKSGGIRVTRMFKVLNPANNRTMVRFAKEEEFSAFPGEVTIDLKEEVPVRKPRRKARARTRDKS